MAVKDCPWGWNSVPTLQCRQNCACYGNRAEKEQGADNENWALENFINFLFDHYNYCIISPLLKYCEKVVLNHVKLTLWICGRRMKGIQELRNPSALRVSCCRIPGQEPKLREVPEMGFPETHRMERLRTLIQMRAGCVSYLPSRVSLLTATVIMLSWLLLGRQGNIKWLLILINEFWCRSLDPEPWTC